MYYYDQRIGQALTEDEASRLVCETFNVRATAYLEFARRHGCSLIRNHGRIQVVSS